MSVGPFSPNLKLEALHATVALEKARLEAGVDPSSTDDLLKDMQAIYDWLK